MGGDEVVVERKVSWWGLFHLHVMSMGADPGRSGAVDIERWIREEVEPMGGEVEGFYKYQEEELGVWHLRLWWKVPGYVGRVASQVPETFRCKCAVEVERE